jgi:hypothetical protein
VNQAQKLDNLEGDEDDQGYKSESKIVNQSSDVLQDDMRDNQLQKKRVSQTEAQLLNLLNPAFEIIEKYCEHQKEDKWKQKVVNYWENREIKLEPIGKIKELCWFGIIAPKKENQKFEFQFGGKHPLEDWRKQDNFEERLLAHCTYINQHAQLI